MWLMIDTNQFFSSQTLIDMHNLRLIERKKIRLSLGLPNLISLYN
jgi:hypothetical protein